MAVDAAILEWGCLDFIGRITDRSDDAAGRTPGDPVHLLIIDDGEFYRFTTQLITTSVISKEIATLSATRYNLYTWSTRE